VILLDKQALVANFSQELRRGTVVLCVLANLKVPTYGYNLIEILSKTGISIEANTLYPLMRRLEGQKLLASEWNTEGAKPRKYYSLTDYGKEVVAELKTQWQLTAKHLNYFLEDFDQ
jgi:DNA-binding PadR family transcriptional regulator